MTSLITLQFSTTPAWSSGIIRWMTQSDFSHVDVVIEHPDGGERLFGASDPGGVIERPPDYETFLRRRRARIFTSRAESFLNEVATQSGKPFDDKALHAFMFANMARDWRDPASWFCSELVTWALERVGLFPYKLITHPNRVTPQELLMLLNPFMDVDHWLQQEEQNGTIRN